METATAKLGKVTSTVKAIGGGVFLCIPALWVIGIVTAKDRPVPVAVRGCYKSGLQTLDVQNTRIIVNGNPKPEVHVRYLVTNAGSQIETVDGSWIKLNEAEPPYKQVGRNTVIRVQDDTLLAFTHDGEAVPFVRKATATMCRRVGNRPNPA